MMAIKSEILESGNLTDFTEAILAASIANSPAIDPFGV